MAKLSREEIGRKLLHLFALAMPVCIFYLPQRSISPALISGILAGLFLVSAATEGLRFRVPAIQRLVLTVFGSMMRKEEHSHKVSGWTWVIGAAFLCSVLFAKSPRLSFMALTLFILGDAAAALVGIGLGRIKIGKKTLEGSLACFLMCLILFFGAFPFVPGLLDAWGGKMPWSIALITSVVITIFELVPLKISRDLVINDNLAVPVIAGFVMLGMEIVLFR